MQPSRKRLASLSHSFSFKTIVWQRTTSFILLKSIKDDETVDKNCWLNNGYIKFKWDNSG